MKKRILFAVFTAVTVLLLAGALTSCKLFDKIKDTVESAAEGGETLSPEEKKVEEVLTGKVDLDAMSQQELLAYIDALQDEDNELLNQGAEYDLYYGKADASGGFDADAELSFDDPADANVVTITDDPWVDKEYEAVDVTANMGPAEKAEFEVAMRELENFDADAYQKEIDEMLQGIEGFEDYDPESGDDDPDAPSILTEWPDSELGRQVPKPPFEGGFITESSENIAFTVTGVSMDAVEAYVRSLKSAGFLRNLQENEQSVAGITIYSYTASNDQGIWVNLALTAGTLTMTVYHGE